MIITFKERQEYNFNIGDIFYEESKNVYYFLSRVGENKYALISDNFNFLFNSRVYGNFEELIKDLEKYVKSNVLNHISNEEYKVELIIDKL